MKIAKRYCPKCKKITKHTKDKEYHGFMRGFMGFMTMGFSEEETYSMCTKCEYHTTTSAFD
jgi:hypothetical protein